MENNNKTFIERLKNILLLEIKIPYQPLTSKIGKIHLSSKLVYEKEVFYKTLLMIIRKGLPLSEGLSTMSNYKIWNVNPIHLVRMSTPSTIINILLYIITRLFWLIFTLCLIIFKGGRLYFLSTKFPYIIYWSKKLVGHIKKGASLDEAMLLSKSHFSELEISFIKTGIKSGKLELAVSELQSYFAFVHSKKHIILTQMLYPIILLIVVILWS